MLATDPIPWSLHPTLAALLPRLELVQDCWHLLAEPDGIDRREHYLPRGEREPESAYRRRLEAALPSGFFRDALRTFAGMLASSHWRDLPAGAICESQGHHAEFGLGWGHAEAVIYTHKVDGLTRADAVLAARFEAMDTMNPYGAFVTDR